MSREPKNNIAEGVNLAGRRLRRLGAAVIVSAPFAIGYALWPDNTNVFNPSVPQPNNSTNTSQEFNDRAPTATEATKAIEFAVQEALTPEPLSTSEITEESVAAHGVDGLHLNSEGVIYYHDWVVPTEVYEADITTSKITGLPLSYMLSVQSLESSFDPNAFNSIKACGLSQFVPSTLAEKAYRYSSLIGFEGIRDDLIIRTSTAIEQTPEQIENEDEVLYNLTYDYADMLSQHTLVETCWDPDFNTRLAAVMQMQDIGRLQRRLAEYAPEGMNHYPVTELHGYVAHFAGGRAGENLLKDLLSNDGKSVATNFFSEAAVANTTNQKLLFNTKTIVKTVDGIETEVIVPDLENPRTVAEFFDFLAEEKGLSDHPLPDFTNWDTIEAQITATMATVEPIYVQKVTALAYSPHPRPRPENLGQTMAEAVSPETRESSAVESSLRPKLRPADLKRELYDLANN